MFGLEPLWDAVARGALLSLIAFAWIILLVRIVGLRSFSKMTSFDFVMTVAMGSLLATSATANQWATFAQAMVAVAGLFFFQYALARVRKHSDIVETLVGNTPVLLMRDGEIIDSAMKATRVSRADLISKLREANVLDMSDVRAVVLEATGDISVLHGDEMADELLDGVQRK